MVIGIAERNDEMRDFIDKTSEQSGTPLNRDNLMAIQGFDAVTTVFGADGSITETNRNGHKLVTTFKDDGSIVETFVGDKTITKTTTFDGGVINEDIKEVIS